MLKLNAELLYFLVFLSANWHRLHVV